MFNRKMCLHKFAGRTMRKWLVALGVFLLISGAVIANSGNPNPTPRVTNQLVAFTERSWEVSGFLNKNDKMVVELWQGLDWPEGNFEPDPDGSGSALLAVYVTVSDPPPNNTSSRFEVLYARRSGEGSGPLLGLWKVNVTRSGGLDTSLLWDANHTTLAGIGGITQYEGTYKAEVDSLYPPREYSPTRIEIRKGVLIIDPPNNSSLQAGVALAVIGAILSLFGLLASKHRRSSHIRQNKS